MQKKPGFNFADLNARLDEMANQRDQNSDFNSRDGVEDSSRPTLSTYLSNTAPPSSGASANSSFNLAFHEGVRDSNEPIVVRNTSEPMYSRAAHPSHLRRDVTMNGTGEAANHPGTQMQNPANIPVNPVAAVDPMSRFLGNANAGWINYDDVQAYAVQTEYAKAQQLLMTMYRLTKVNLELMARLDRLENRPVTDASTQTNGVVEDSDEDLQLC